MNKDFKINREIFVKEVRIIEDTEYNGVMKFEEALKIAESRNVDLVCINENSNPVICKIIEYSKFLFELKKKKKENEKNQVKSKLKEVRFTPTIADNDFNVKVKQACEFLKDGDKVKVSILYKGRMINNKEIGKVKIQEFIEAVQEFGIPDGKTLFDNNNLIVTLKPKK